MPRLVCRSDSPASSRAESLIAGCRIRGVSQARWHTRQRRGRCYLQRRSRYGTPRFHRRGSGSGVFDGRFSGTRAAWHSSRVATDRGGDVWIRLHATKGRSVVAAENFHANMGERLFEFGPLKVIPRAGSEKSALHAYRIYVDGNSVAIMSDVTTPAEIAHPAPLMNCATAPEKANCTLHTFRRNGVFGASIFTSTERLIRPGDELLLAYGPEATKRATGRGIASALAINTRRTKYHRTFDDAPPP